MKVAKAPGRARKRRTGDGERADALVANVHKVPSADATP